jgi:hypothetical protein
MDWGIRTQLRIFHDPQLSRCADSNHSGILQIISLYGASMMIVERSPFEKSRRWSNGIGNEAGFVSGMWVPNCQRRV